MWTDDVPPARAATLLARPAPRVPCRRAASARCLATYTSGAAAAAAAEEDYLVRNSRNEVNFT